MEFRSLAANAINHAVLTRRLAAAGIPPESFSRFENPTRITNRGLARKEASGAISYGEADRDLFSFLLPFGLVMLMFMVVLIGAVPMLQGIAEEKQNRIAEVLISSVTPFRLMAGKVPPEIQLDLIEAAARRPSRELHAKLEQYEASKPQGDPLAPYREALAGVNARRGRQIFFSKA